MPPLGLQAGVTQLGWNLISRRDALWVRFIREKYNCGEDIIPQVKKPKSESQAWKGIRKSWEQTINGVGWQLGDGCRIRFWEDRWLPYHDKLSSYVIRELDERVKPLCVTEFVSSNGDWLWDKFTSFLPGTIIHAIRRIRPSNWNGREDRPIWWKSTDGNFSIRSAYMAQCRQQGAWRKVLWRKIWKLPVPQRYRHFLWSGRDRLLTNHDRFRMGMYESSKCTLCDCTKEDVLHALRDCTIASKCWEYILPQQFHQQFSTFNDVAQWMQWNLSIGTLVMGFSWRSWFAVLCRHIWLNRNAHIFQNSAVGFMQILAHSRAILSVSKLEADGAGNTEHKTGLWQPPYVGCIKINVDGATYQKSNESACAGVARDHDGTMLDGFMFRMAKGTSLHAELWAVLWGLKRAWDLQWRRIIVETDCREAVDLLNRGWMDTHQEVALLTEIRQWLEKEWEATISWCCRCANEVADFMAKKALTMAEGIVFLSQPPDFIVEALRQDATM